MLKNNRLIQLLNAIPPLFPRLCEICQQTIGQESHSQVLCTHCETRLSLNLNYCQSCAQPITMLNKTSMANICGACLQQNKDALITQWLIPFQYEGEMKRLIRRMKFHKNPALAKGFGQLLSFHAHAFIDQQMIMPVPIDPIRLSTRGFNPSLIMAQTLVPKARIIQCLTKQSFTLPQSLLTKKERLHNLDSAFYITGEIPKEIILLDDVTTTGTTLNKIAEQLKSHGCQKIKALVLAGR